MLGIDTKINQNVMLAGDDFGIEDGCYECE
mgnify:CR=1 FL=1